MSARVGCPREHSSFTHDWMDRFYSISTGLFYQEIQNRGYPDSLPGNNLKLYETPERVDTKTLYKRTLKGF